MNLKNSTLYSSFLVLCIIIFYETTLQNFILGGFEMRRRQNRKVKQSRFEELLEIPKEISSQNPKLTVMGFEELLVENYKAILEYQDFYIRLSTHIGIININGFELNLNEMTNDDILITGKIESVDFERTTDA